MIKNLKVYNDCNEKQAELINIIGKRKSGKTTLILNIIDDKKDCYNHILYYSPNAKRDDTIINGIKQIKKNIIISDDLDVVKEYIELIEKKAQNNINNGKKRELNLLIIDDSSGDEEIFPKSNPKNFIIKALINGRHIGLSIILSLHRFNTVAPVIRDLVNYIYLFPNNTKTNKLIADETKIEPDIIDFISNKYYKNPRDFLLIDNDDNKIYYHSADSNNNILVYDKFKK